MSAQVRALALLRALGKQLKSALAGLLGRGCSQARLQDLRCQHQHLQEQHQLLHSQYTTLCVEFDRLRAHPIFSASFPAILERLKKRGSRVQTVIDVGASDGKWSEQLMELLPQAKYLLFECDPNHRAGLEHFVATHPGSHCVMAAASNSDQAVYLKALTLDSGRVTHDATAKGYSPVAATTVDTEVARLQLPGPYFLKLDVHGFERQVLQGATQVVQESELIMVEMLNFTLGLDDSVRFPAMCQHLDDLGFRPLHLCDPHPRPLDGALFHFDIVFARKDSPEFHFEGWR